MRITKVLNNNLVLARDGVQGERVVMGKGVGFKKRPGDLVASGSIDKVFILESKALVEELETLVQSVPSDHLELTKQVVEESERMLGVSFSDFVYIGLVDHLSYALQRNSEGLSLGNALSWEIRRFYPEEYAAAVHALDIVERFSGVRLPESEASFIAMHFVNAETDPDGHGNGFTSADIIRDILNIVRYHYLVDLDEESAAYGRFVTHIRYFLKRPHQMRRGPVDLFLFEQVKDRYPEAFACATKISRYLEETTSSKIQTDELLYLMIHVNTLATRGVRAEE